VVKHGQHCTGWNFIKKGWNLLKVGREWLEVSETGGKLVELVEK
jgi:hypothetical protein